MLGSAHAAANPLTAHCNVIHGEAVGLMLPQVVRFHAAEKTACQQYVELARAAGLADGEDAEDRAVLALIERLEHLLNLANVPRSLPEAGVPAAQIPALAAEAARQWTAQFNPRPVTEKDFTALYEAAFAPRHGG